MLSTGEHSKIQKFWMKKWCNSSHMKLQYIMKYNTSKYYDNVIDKYILLK